MFLRISNTSKEGESVKRFDDIEQYAAHIYEII